MLPVAVDPYQVPTGVAPVPAIHAVHVGHDN